MNISDLTPARTVAVEIVDVRQQSIVLKRYLGVDSARIEGDIYALMRRLSPDHRQGLWRLYELSNGAFYLAPDVERLCIQVERTSFNGVLSGDAVGIAATLLGLRNGCRVYGNDGLFTVLFRLRDFARKHPEGVAILAATD